MTAFLAVHPEIAVVAVFLVALAAHVLVGALLHLLRLHDFDWHRLGAFVEQDFATQRGLAILVSFLLTMLTASVPGEWRAGFGVAFAALLASAGAATLPIVRDTVYELLELLATKPVA